MEQLSNISAEEIFGTASRLAEQADNNTLLGIASLGGAYQVATGVVALLFIFILVRHFDLFRYLIISSFSKQSNRPDIHIYSTELKNIELLTSLMGVMLLSLLVMRLSVFDITKTFFASLHPLSVWKIGGVSLVAILATMFGERLMLYVVGAVSGRNDACTDKPIRASLTISGVNDSLSCKPNTCKNLLPSISTTFFASVNKSLPISIPQFNTSMIRVIF